MENAKKNLVFHFGGGRQASFFQIGYVNKKQLLKILWSEVWKGGFQLMQILGLLGMYFDAVVVEVEKYVFTFFQIGAGHTVYTAKVQTYFLCAFPMQNTCNTYQSHCHFYR